MNNCPISGLREVLKKLNPRIPKSKDIGKFETMGITENDFLESLESLKEIRVWSEKFSYSSMGDVSLTGNRIYNFFLANFYTKQAHKHRRMPILGGNFIPAAIRTLDKIIIGAIADATDINDLHARMSEVRKTFKNKSLFYGKIEDAVLDYFPHQVQHILNTDNTGEWEKLCPAFKFMDKVCDAIFPHYERAWLGGFNRF